MFTTLVPAYGRDYKSAKEVKADWDAGKDFQIANAFSPDDGKYINKADARPGQLATNAVPPARTARRERPSARDRGSRARA